uniref:Uncharacterized protein n=1 Tax=Anguilla anguilla TaxID=7936 RepID=A0A0E9UH23_ANGAN
MNKGKEERKSDGQNEACARTGAGLIGQPAWRSPPS